MCDYSSLETIGEPLYIANLDYPGAVRSINTQCSCSVETSSCTAKINVYFVHFQLQDGGNSCIGNQTLEINDNGNTASFNCFSNTNYNISRIMTTSTNYLTASFLNPFGVSDGHMWIGFECKCVPVSTAHYFMVLPTPNPNEIGRGLTVTNLSSVSPAGLR